MKQYGANKATEFSRKQVGVIYYMGKSGKLKIEQWIMSNMFDLADYYGYDSNCRVESDERDILHILDAVFAGNLETAQALITETTDRWYQQLGRKYQSNIDRNSFVK